MSHGVDEARHRHISQLIEVRIERLNLFGSCCGVCCVWVCGCMCRGVRE